ncbi:hypothetical protein BECAL_02170 [Bellilinea caldifistulae]|nr:hypothetical protein BECAL_02170 [Bellilinea caldifistulae]
MSSRPTRISCFIQFILIFLSGCSNPAPALSSPASSLEANYSSPSPTLFTDTPIPSSTISPTESTLPSQTLTPLNNLEPAGCQKPDEDYTILTFNGVLLNQRTYSMLRTAAQLYQGEIDILGDAITQGSYTQQVDASFGTHAGGGAVDLSVMREGTYTILWDEIPLLIHALRVAGFAAWLRDLDELYPGSPIHIHAIAIGDQQLSRAAQEQLTGDYGYFRGYSGLPPGFGGPSLDRHGGPILCRWMIEAGYSDLRLTPTPDPIGDQLDCHKCQIK